jgi:hypothetical protein
MRGAGAAESMTAVYAFSWAGLDVGRFEVRLDADAGGYRASWEAGTSGLVGTLFPFTSQGTAAGRRDGDRFQPDHYDGSSAWRDGGSQWRVAFAPDGRATQIDVPADDLAGREPVPEALKVGPDPASLALSAIAQAAPGARLDGQSFDGRRAVRVELACADADADADLACTLSGRLLAGASREWRERAQGQTEREPWRVWLRAGVHGQGLWPVRLEAPSRFGTVGARLISIDRLPAAG